MSNAQTITPAHAQRYIDGVPRPLAFQTADAALDWAESTRTRVRVHYGYATPAARGHAMARDSRADVDVPAVGQDWGEVYDVSGRIGRSMGTPGRPETRIRIMVANASSDGGGAILSPDCIVRVRYANRAEGGDLYRHPDYLPPARGDAFPDDVVRSARDYARHFAADPGDPRGQTIDHITAGLQNAGVGYALRHAEDGVVIEANPLMPDRPRTLAVVHPDGSGVRYYADGTPEHLGTDGVAISYP